MKPSDHDSSAPILSFSGASALLLLVAAFCAYPCGAYTPALLFAGLAFAMLSLASTAKDAKPLRIRDVESDRGDRRRI